MKRLLLACLLVPLLAAPVRADSSSIKLVSGGWKVIERNNVYWKVAWRVEVENRSSRDLVGKIRAVFKDADGYALDDDTLYDQRLPAGQTVALSNYTLIASATAQRISTMSATVTTD